jgi:hypothetical protein
MLHPGYLERIPKSNKKQKTSINYLNSSQVMIDQVKKNMVIKIDPNDKPYHKVNRQIKSDNNKESIISHVCSQNFLNRDKAPLRKQIEDNTGAFGRKHKINHHKVEMLPVGRIKKEQERCMVAGNLIREQDILQHPKGEQAGDSINITIPQDQMNKTIPKYREHQYWQPYDKNKYTRIGDVLQRMQSDLISANRLLLTQPFARIYIENRRKGYDHLTAYQITINAELDHHQRKDHEMFDPFIEAGTDNLEMPHHKKIRKITEEITPDGYYGKTITNLAKLDVDKLKSIADILTTK